MPPRQKCHHLAIIKEKGGSYMSNIIKAAAYVRFSSDNQRDESIDAQVRAIEVFAKDKGIQVVKVYADRAKSATSDKRPEFQQMIQDSSLDFFDAIIVHKLDRFSRDKYDSATYKRKLKKNGIRLISVTENLDGSPESIILESVIEGMAEYYSKNLAREVMKGMTENAYKCMHTGGKPPLGYEVDPMTKKYVINESEAIIVREIFSMYNDGYGYRQIVSAINSKGYKTKLGRPFGNNSIHDLLSNEKYSGTYVFNRSASKNSSGQRNHHSSKAEDDIIRIENGMPAIISKEEFQKANQRMDKNKKGPGTYKSKEIYLLSGLIFCGECGHAMSGNMRYGGRNKNKYVSYRCGNRERTKQCCNKELRREYIESYVLHELEKNIFNDAAIPFLIEKLNEYQNSKSVKNTTEADAMKRLLDEINRQIENIVNAIASGFFQSSFKDKVTELEEQKAALELKLKEIELSKATTVITEEMLRNLFSMFREFVTTRNIPECKKFIDSYVDKVVVYQDHVEVTFKVAFSLQQKEDCFLIKSSIITKKLFKMFPVAI